MKKRASLPDTNFILRYLLRDNEAHFIEASDFFEKVRIGKESILISESVLVECLYVLTKHYKVPRGEAARSLGGIFIYKGIVNPDCDILSKALTLFAESTLDPVDCILLQKATAEGHILRTFDKALLKRIDQSQ
jgi:predicted nucleic-acid-binding protein